MTALGLVVFLSDSVDLQAASVDIAGSVFQRLLDSADKALTKGDKKAADFYMARYLGLGTRTSLSDHGADRLTSLLKKRKLSPKAFVPVEWDKDFIDWFEKGTYRRWGVEDPRVREKARTFEISNASYKDRFFVTIVASPELQLWHVVKNGIVERPLLIPMGSFPDKPALFFGKLFKGVSSAQFNVLYLETRKRALHYVWKPIFYDVDKDGLPEVWIRYNLAWGNGFLQVLDVYRIKNESELVLLKRFDAGEEGAARLLPDGEVLIATTDMGPMAHAPSQRDRHHVETWTFKEGSFQKVSEKDVPYLYIGGGWRDHFLEA